MIASVQPYHAIDDGRWAEKRIGPERAKTTYAFRSFLDAGVRLAFGTDWYVAPLDPMQTLYAAVTRATLDGKHPGGWVPEQKITLAEAIEAYTAGAAYAEFQEQREGQLVAGQAGRLRDAERGHLRDPARADPRREGRHDDRRGAGGLSSAAWRSRRAALRAGRPPRPRGRGAARSRPRRCGRPRSRAAPRAAEGQDVGPAVHDDRSVVRGRLSRTSFANRPTIAARSPKRSRSTIQDTAQTTDTRAASQAERPRRREGSAHGDAAIPAIARGSLRSSSRIRTKSSSAPIEKRIENGRRPSADGGEPAPAGV